MDSGQRLPHHQKLKHKLFFLPHTVYISPEGYGYALKYAAHEGAEPHADAWAGRVLPGQTIEEGIGAELNAELGYTGRFSWSDQGLEGHLKDKKGKDIPRHKIDIYLYDKTFQSVTAHGQQVALGKHIVSFKNVGQEGATVDFLVEPVRFPRPDNLET